MDLGEEAKKVELKKLRDFKSYEEVRDSGQYRITCTFICWYKGDEVRARLVARGFEEVEKVPSDSPTVEKCNLRLIFAICAGNKWEIATSDVKSAFLQGRRLEREKFWCSRRGKLKWKRGLCGDYSFLCMGLATHRCNSSTNVRRN